MIYLVKRKKPNAELIRALRKSINLSQEALLAEMKKEDIRIARSTYQKMEKGKETQIMYFEELIKFYTKRLPINHKYRKIKIDDLFLAPKKKNLKATKKEVVNALKVEESKFVGELEEAGKGELEEVEERFFAGKLQDVEQVVMYRVSSFDDVIKNISASSKRKFYYKVDKSYEDEKLEYGPDGGVIRSASTKSAIKSIVNQIDSFKSKPNLNNENFGSTKNEFEKLDEVANFSKDIGFLNKRGISLYVGLLYLPQYQWKPLSSHPGNMDYEYKVGKTIYTIFCFKDDLHRDLIFHYENVWPEDLLNHFLKKEKGFKLESSDDHGIREVEDAIKIFQEEIKYFPGIDDSKVEFDHDLRGKELLDTEIYEDSGFEPDDEIPF